LKQLLLKFAVLLLSFFIGCAAALGIDEQFQPAPGSLLDPLEVRVISREPIDGPLRTDSVRDYRINFAVRNTGNKSIRAYTLGHSDASSHGFLPVKEFVLALRPGESRDGYLYSRSNEESKFWVDFVRFDDGVCWGPDKSGSARYTSPLTEE
jgi:hypothetical protein